MSQLSSFLNFVVFVAMIGAGIFYVVTPKTPKELPNDQEFSTQIQKPGTVLVKFGATWCPPCRMIESELDQLAASSSGQVSVVKIDVDHNRKLASHYGVSSIPHLILFQNGKPVAETKGYRNRDQLQAWIAAAH